MAVKYNLNLGVWQIDGRGAYATEAEARAADTPSAQPTVTYDEDEFANSFNRDTRVLAPAGSAATGTTPAEAAARQTEFEASDALFRQGYQDLNNDGKITQEDVTLSGVAYGTPASQGGTASGYAVQQVNLGDRDAQLVNGRPTRRTYTVKGLPGEGAEGFSSAYSYYNTPGGTGTRITGDVRNPNATGVAGPGGYEPTIIPTSGRATIDQEAADAKSDAKDKQQQASAENDWLYDDTIAAFRNLKGGEYGLSDEARGYQKEGLQQQRMLLERLFGFDEAEYAAKFGDQTLSRMIAAGRQGTSAAEQQAGRFAALEQAPAVYAEGQRQADAMANQRLGMAESAAKAFGELGTMTRGQDENRAQFEAQLPLEIQKQVAAMTQGKMQLNQQEAEVLSQIWMEFAELQSVYAGMDSAEMMAWWDRMTTERGQDKQFEAIKAQIRANGAISDKDIMNGIFQLGGGLLGLAGRGGAS